MAIESLKIFIYDTKLPEDVLNVPLNYAEKDSVKWVYEGGDDKFFGLFPSRFELSMEVPIDQASKVLYYDHLFSGEENRFKLIVHDQDDQVLWEGFLMPDVYQEPFKTGAFYIELKASDGLPAIKGKTLNENFYRARHSVPKIFADCLTFTGLDYDIYLDLGLENLGAGQNWHEIYLSGASWATSDDRASAYDILENMLTDLNAILYQREGKWYVVGVSRFGINTNTWRRYNSAGVYQNTITAENTYRNLEWFDEPSVSLKPPFKEVIVTTGVDELNALFPSDIVVQDWTKTQEPQGAPPAKYWTGAGVDPVLGPLSGTNWPTFAGDPITQNSIVTFVQTLSDPTEQQIQDTYISLTRPPYIKGEARKINFRLKIKTIWLNTGNVFNLEGAINDDLVRYDLTLNGATIISNKPGFSNRDAYRLQFSNTYQDNLSIVTGEIEVKDFIVYSDGVLDLKVHHTDKCEADFFGNVVGAAFTVGIQEFSIDYNVGTNNVFAWRRSLDRTNTYEVETVAGDSVTDQIDEAFIYQPTISLGELTEVQFGIATITTGSNQVIEGVVFPQNSTNFDLINNNIDAVYLLRYKSDFFEYIEDITNNGSTSYFIVNLYDGQEVTAFDKIFVRPATPGNPQSGAVRNYRELWNRSHAGTAGRYGAVLARLIHDVYSKPLICMEGVAKWPLLPGDRLGRTMELATPVFKSFIPTRIEIQPERNRTQVTVIELDLANVTDYE